MSDDTKTTDDLIKEAGGEDAVDKLAEDNTVIQLAGLTPLEYDRLRRKKAKELGCRTTTLDKVVAKARESDGTEGGGTAVLFDDIEPAVDPVNGAVLLDQIVTTLNEFVVTPAGAADAVALWILHAWTHETSRVSPLLAITSPEKRCGKTTLLTLLQRMTPRSLPTSNITAAALFRAVEKWAPTLLIDEADTFIRSSDELRGILNSGHTVDSAFVIRTTGDDHEPRAFRTWAPKAIALIGKLPPTLADRSIEIPLRRRLPSDNVQRLRIDRLELRELQSKAARWAQDNADSLFSSDPELPSTLHDRAADNWRPLSAITEQISGDWPDRLRAAIRELTESEESDDGVRVTLLADIRDILAEQGSDRISSDDLIDRLVGLEDRPWPEWKHGKPLSKNGLARLLRDFKIRPQGVRIGDRTPRGYRKDQFKDAFSRYLPDSSATTQQPPQNAGYRRFESATAENDVAVGNTRETAPESQSCSVADETPPPRQKKYNDPFIDPDHEDLTL